MARISPSRILLRIVTRLLALVGNLWIRAQIRRHWRASRPLRPGERVHLEAYFDEELLSDVRIREVRSVSRPWFIRPLALFGLKLDMDFRSAAGITFGDLVLVSELGRGRTLPAALLFHELIHVLQYRALGIGGFALKYVDGWLSHGREYLRIPLEVEAYALEDRFRAGEIFRAATCWSRPD